MTYLRRRNPLRHKMLPVHCGTFCVSVKHGLIIAATLVGRKWVLQVYNLEDGKLVRTLGPPRLRWGCPANLRRSTSYCTIDDHTSQAATCTCRSRALEFNVAFCMQSDDDSILLYNRISQSLMDVSILDGTVVDTLAEGVVQTDVSSLACDDHTIVVASYRFSYQEEGSYIQMFEKDGTHIRDVYVRGAVLRVRLVDPYRVALLQLGYHSVFGYENPHVSETDIYFRDDGTEVPDKYVHFGRRWVKDFETCADGGYLLLSNRGVIKVDSAGKEEYSSTHSTASVIERVSSASYLVNNPISKRCTVITTPRTLREQWLCAAVTM